MSLVYWDTMLFACRFGIGARFEGYIAMSMNAMFVQVEDAEIAGFEADPDSVEALFTDQTLPTAGLLNMTAAMQERLRTIGPQAMAAAQGWAIITCIV